MDTNSVKIPIFMRYETIGGKKLLFLAAQSIILEVSANAKYPDMYPQQEEVSLAERIPFGMKSF